MANWPVINHSHCELHDQLREPGPHRSLSASVVHFPGPSRKCLVELCQAVARSVVQNSACDLRRSRVGVDNGRHTQMERSC